MAAEFEGRIDPQSADDESATDVLSVIDDKEFKDWVALKRSLRIVVTGKTGAGKSTLLNGFVGGKASPFKEGDGFDPQTLQVQQHKFVKHNVEVTVWDCPGLQDGTNNEEQYLQDLEDKTGGDIDVMLYCISMEEVRFDQECHGDAMLKLTLVLKNKVWSHTVIVLTFANRVVKRLMRQDCLNVDEKFGEKVKEWREKIQQLMRDINCTDEQTDIEKIRVVPAGFRKPSLPGYKYWLSSLWEEIFATLKTDEAKAAAIVLNRHRFRTDPNKKYVGVSNKRPPPVSEDEFKKEIEDQPIVVSPDMEANLHKVGAEIVAVSSVGVIVGATIGGIITGAVSFGTGAPVGAGIGGVIGGGIGFIACSLFQVYKHRKASASKSQRKSTLEEECSSDNTCITPEPPSSDDSVTA